MRWIGFLMFILVACNLTTQSPVTPTAVDVPAQTDEAVILPTTADVPLLRTATPDGTPALPTLLPLPGVLGPIPGGTPLGGQCAVYTTYSGVDPNNKLSLRAQPSTSAPQVFKVPNNAQVYLVPDSQEIEAEGYHWLNVIYVEGANRYTGWMARDSFMERGVRRPEIATLRSTGQQAAC